ncbi:hypothetical protein R6Q59_015161 [Mikania micrantha]
MESIQTTIMNLLKIPSQIKSISQAKQIHAQIAKSFPIFTSDLLSIYTKFDLLPESIILFNTLPSPSIHAWKSIIKCYSSNAYFFESVKCFVKMRGIGIHPDHNVFPSVLKACTHLMYFKFGESVHASVIRFGLELDIFTGNALLSMYSTLQRFSALQVFDESPERMTVYQSDSILHHHNINNYKLCPEVCQSCQNPSFLNQFSNRGLGNLQMQSVRKVFETMPEQDVVSYNTLIMGYAQNTMYNEAMMMIREMGNAKLKPDAYTLSSVLPIVAKYMDAWKGKEIHGYGIRHGFESNIFITSGLTDMYANCKMLEDSYQLFCSLPDKDCVSWCSMIAACVQNGLFDEGFIFDVWLPLLAACRVHKNVELAKKVVLQMSKFDGDNVGAYVLLSNTYSSVGKYKDAANVRQMLSKKMNKKEPACSWIRIGEKVHAFVTGDESHSSYDCIINALNILFGQIKKEAYVTGH